MYLREWSESRRQQNRRADKKAVEADPRLEMALWRIAHVIPVAAAAEAAGTVALRSH